MACGDIATCVVPEPDPLACDAVCEAVEMCEAGDLLPDCVADCPDTLGIAACAEHIVGGVCDTEAFATCLGEQVNTECGTICARSAECNIAEQAACLEACFEAAQGDDPLAQRRLRQRSECVATASEDCFRVNQCVDDDAVRGRGNTCLEACEGLAECGIVAADMLRECLTQCEQSLEDDPDTQQFVIDCTVEFLVPGGCQPDGIMACLTLEPPVRPAPCVALCEARALCERDDGIAEAACVQQCQDARVAGGGLWRLQLPCGRASTCDDFGACMDDADPEVGCDAHCGLLDGCMLAGEACAAECVASFGQGRARAHRECVEAAGEDCEAMAVCDPGEPPPCEAYCDRLDECMLGADPPDPAACVAACDDDHFADPEATTTRVACVLGAPVCDPANPFQPEHAVSACLLDPGVGEPFSRGCLAWCSARLECGDGEGDVGACVRDCGDGLQGADALRFAQAQACLLEAEGCAALTACIPDEVEVDCEAFCGAVDGCGLPAEDCAATCADAPDADAAGCVVDATSRRRGCEAIAACVGFEAPEVDPACTTVCEARATCDAEIDVFRCGLGCTPAPDGLGIQAACAELAACDDLADCLQLDAPDDACAEACAGVDACGVEVAECAEVCTGRDASGAAPDDYVAGAAACVDGLEDGCDADAANACFDLESECEAGCALLSHCNPLMLVGTPEECVALMCPDGQIVDLWALSIQCSLRVFGAGVCDEQAYLDCLAGM